jgi:NDP-sugar pyrophosphorylase family protein
MERERITISIRKNVLNAIDRTIDGIEVRNRSHAIETLAMKAIKQNSNGNAVILVGGEDALKTIPQVKENLKKLELLGLESAYIAVGYLANEIKDKIGDSSFGKIDLEYIESEEGSAGVLLPLKNEYSDTFMVINNIDIKKLDIEEMLEQHNNSNAVVTVVTNDLETLNGLYICEPEIFSYISKGFSMLETDVFPRLIADKKLIIKPI